MNLIQAGADIAAAQTQILAHRGHNLSSNQVAHLMSLPSTSVHVDTALANFLIRYDNRDYIADQVLPVVPVSRRSDKIFELPVETMQTLAQVQMSGSRARPNELSYSIQSTKSYSVKDYGLLDFVSNDEEENADAPLQPRLMSADIVMNFLMLAREQRAAGVVFNPANYGTNASALSGSARWDVSTGTPVQNIFDAIESCFVRPNVLCVGGQVWPKLRNNPEIVKFVTGRASTSQGAVPFFVDEDMFAKAFGLDKLIVGRAKYNSAREGATVASGYLWGKGAALIRVEPNPNPRATKTFGYTYRFGGKAPQNQVIPEIVAGVRGGVYVKITHSDDEQTVGGGTAGYYYDTVIS